MTVFIDTSVLMYAVGGPHPRRSACREVMARINDGTLEAATSAEVIQEILHRFGRGDRAKGITMATSVLELFDDVLAINRDVVAAATNVLTDLPRSSARDCLHIATCIVNGIGEIVSTDVAFDAAPGVRRIDPEDVAEQA